MEISPGWRLFGDIGECQIYDILQIFSKHSPSFPKRSPLSPNVLRVRRTFSRKFGNVENSRDHSRNLTFHPKSPVAPYPNIHQDVANYSPGSQFVHQTVSKQSPIRRLIATLANKSTNVCRTILKQSPFRRQMIAEFANYSPILPIFVSNWCGCKMRIVDY